MFLQFILTDGTKALKESGLQSFVPAEVPAKDFTSLPTDLKKFVKKLPN